MKTKILHISILVIFCVGFFYLGWYTHKTAPINTATVLNEYDEYVSSVDSVCPFVSTASTGDCLDKEISKQKQNYNILSNEILATAKARSDEDSAQNLPVDLETSGILFNVPAYNKTRDTYIEQLCALKNESTTGTAIIEESRKCVIYYNSKDIQILENLKMDEAEIAKLPLGF